MWKPGIEPPPAVYGYVSIPVPVAYDDNGDIDYAFAHFDHKWKIWRAALGQRLEDVTVFYWFDLPPLPEPPAGAAGKE